MAACLRPKPDKNCCTSAYVSADCTIAGEPPATTWKLYISTNINLHAHSLEQLNCLGEQPEQRQPVFVGFPEH